MSILFKDYLNQPYFPVQKQRPNCGAYATAYFLWAEGIEDKPEIRSLYESDNETEAEIVNNIYEEIKFAPTFNVINNKFCSPAKIMLYLNKMNICSSFIISDELTAIKDKVLSDAGCTDIDSEDTRLTKLDLQEGYNFEAMDNDSFLLSLFNTNAGLHYVLIKRESGLFYYSNSWDGVIRGGTPSFKDCFEQIQTIFSCFNEGDYNYQFANSGILIKKG